MLVLSARTSDLHTVGLAFLGAFASVRWPASQVRLPTVDAAVVLHTRTAIDETMGGTFLP